MAALYKMLFAEVNGYKALGVCKFRSENYFLLPNTVTLI